MRNVFFAVLFAVVAGCNQAPPPPEGTGAEEAAQEFYLAMLSGDWAKAYAALDQASRQHLPEQEFKRKARSQREAIGFEPKEFHVRACEEHGGEAIAHIVVIGETATGRRVYRDDVVLHRGASAWGVVLSAHFGRPQAKRAKMGRPGLFFDRRSPFNTHPLVSARCPRA